MKNIKNTRLILTFRKQLILLFFVGFLFSNNSWSMMQETKKQKSEIQNMTYYENVWRKIIKFLSSKDLPKVWMSMIKSPSISNLVRNSYSNRSLSITNMNIGNAFFSGAKHGCLQRIKKLDLSNSKFSTTDLALLPKSLVELSLDHIRKENDTDFMSKIIYSFYRLKNLKKVSLANNAITDSEISDFIFFIIKNKIKITDLNLSGNHIRGDGVLQIAQMNGIKKLNLSRNNIEIAGFMQLQQMKEITDLDLSYNHIGDSEVDFISKISSVKRLNLNHNRITEIGAEKISEMPEITELNLSNNQITDNGLRFLAQMQELTHLNLSNNQITNDSTNLISEMRNRAIEIH
jgi:Leucine-rich repeat (LRR) protein